MMLRFICKQNIICICVLFLLMLSGLSSYSQSTNFKFFRKNLVECVVIKIDSIGDYYVIDAIESKGNFVTNLQDYDKYQIISKKVNCNVNLLQEKVVYEFNIMHLYPNETNSCQEHLFEKHNGIKIDIDWGFNLYACKELVGRCYDTIGCYYNSFYSSCDSISSFYCQNDSTIISLTIDDSCYDPLWEIDFESNNLSIFIAQGYIKKKKRMDESELINRYISNKRKFIIKKDSISYIGSRLFDETKLETLYNNNQKIVLKGFVYFKYKNYYYFIGSYLDEDNREVKTSGWIRTRYLINFFIFNKNYHAKNY